MSLVLDERMKCVAGFIDGCKMLSDVGTDHGKLPVHAVMSGKAEKAVASDINYLPLQKAEKIIKQYGLDEKIKTVQTDGLKGIGIYNPTHVSIAGMGGEMIQKILCEADFSLENINFILQPMTKIPLLREFLYSSGFDIYDEGLCFEKKLYQVICARYDGVKRSFTQTELLIGKINIKKKEPLFQIHVDNEIKKLNKIVKGKEKAGLDFSKEAELIRVLKIGETL